MITLILITLTRKLESTVTFQEVAYTQPDLNEFVPPERSVDSEYPSCTLPFASSLENMGVCMPNTYFADQLSFCGDYVKYAACVSPRQPLWSDWNATSKDLLLKAQFKAAIDARITKEMTKDSNGEFIQIRFSQNMDCIEAFKRALCWANFPACDADDGRSFPVCTSACRDFMTACKYGDFVLCDQNPQWPLPPAQVKESVLQCTGSASFVGVMLGSLIIILALFTNSYC
jgi:hypothetical protein